MNDNRNYDNLNLEQIDTVLFTLRSDVIDIKKQIELYKSSPAKPDWLPKIKAALSIKNLQIADLERRRLFLNPCS